jgi:hypothetical protein
MRVSSNLALALSLVLTSLLACDSKEAGEDTSTVFSTVDVAPMEGTWGLSNANWDRDDCGASLMLAGPEAVAISDTTDTSFALAVVFPVDFGLPDLETTCTLDAGTFVCVEASQSFMIYSSQVDLGATVTGSLSSAMSGRMSAELALACTGPECMGFDGCVLIHSADITHDM